MKPNPDLNQEPTLTLSSSDRARRASRTHNLWRFADNPPLPGLMLYASDPSVVEGKPATFTARATDLDCDPLTFNWEIIEDPEWPTYAEHASAFTQVDALNDRTTGGVRDCVSTSVVTIPTPDMHMDYGLVVRVTVADSDGASASDVAGFHVLNKNTNTIKPHIYLVAPQAGIAGTQRTSAVSGEQVELLGTAYDTESDPEDMLYRWVQTAGPDAVIEDAMALQTTFVAPMVTEEQTLTFQVYVTDESWKSARASVDITVSPPANTPPTVGIGANQAPSAVGGERGGFAGDGAGHGVRAGRPDLCVDSDRRSRCGDRRRDRAGNCVRRARGD